MRVLINGLSIGHLSGQHVVYGFLNPIFRWTEREHEFVLLHYDSSPPPASLNFPHVTWHSLPDSIKHWALRSVWEACNLDKLSRQLGCDLIFTPSGAITPLCKTPQVSLAQNPWCFVPAARQGLTDALKASLQRRGYRHALRNARLMVFISDHLRSLYRGGTQPVPQEAPTEVAYVALSEETHSAAQKLRPITDRLPLSIVSVSAMARWKGAETLVAALHQLQQRGIAATLRFVGPWPDAEYEQQIRRQIADLNLDSSVTITGMVSKDQLHQEYAQAQVFCLMSKCESFGIPAAEAQAFGTPVVSSLGCAIPEICAQGGLFGPAGDVNWTASALQTLLTEHHTWRQFSDRALNNASTLHWETCARPLMKMFDQV